MLGLMAPDYLEREVYCCGPEPLCKRCATPVLATWTTTIESWRSGVEADQPALDDVVPDDDSSAKFLFATSVTAKVAETYRPRRRAPVGLNIPSGCTFGVCGTCKVNAERFI